MVHFFEDPLEKAIYIELQIDVKNDKNVMTSQHDDAPPQSGRLLLPYLHRFLQDDDSKDKSPQSPDLCPNDLFFWGHFKLYATQIANLSI